MTLDQYLSLLRRRWGVIASFVLVGIGFALWHIHTTPKTYQSETAVYVSTATRGDARQSLSSVQLTLQLVDSYAKVAASEATRERIRSDLGLTPTQPLGGSLQAQAAYNSLLLRLRATSTSPLRAQQIALDAPSALETVLAALSTNSVNRVSITTVDPAPFPRFAAGPAKKKGLALGIMLGTLLGIVAAASLDSLDRTIRTVGEGKTAFGTQPLAVIPARRRFARKKLALDRAHTPSNEAYRALRTAIGSPGAKGVARSILIASPHARDGKTTIAANLAIVMAQSGASVCLLDANLRRPGISRLLGVKGPTGLTTVLSDASTLSESLVEVHGVYVLPSGPRTANPSELLGSSAFAELIDALMARFDRVIIDTPAVVAVTDAVVMAARVDAILLVARQRRTSRADGARARDLLAFAGAPIVGFVLNAARGRYSGSNYDEFAPELITGEEAPSYAAEGADV